MKSLKVGKGNLSRNEWRSGSSSLSCWREVGAPGFKLTSTSIFGGTKVRVQQNQKITLCLREILLTFTWISLVCVKVTLHLQNIICYWQVIVPTSCFCVTKDNTQGFGNLLYSYMRITDPLRKIFFIVGHRIVGRAPGTGTLIDTFFVLTMWVYSKVRKYGQVDLNLCSIVEGCQLRVKVGVNLMW